MDFPHYDDPLTETGNIWGFSALSGERVGVNVEGGGGGRRHISDALRQVLSTLYFVLFGKPVIHPYATWLLNRCNQVNPLSTLKNIGIWWYKHNEIKWTRKWTYFMEQILVICMPLWLYTVARSVIHSATFIYCNLCHISSLCTQSGSMAPHTTVGDTVNTAEGR